MIKIFSYNGVNPEFIEVQLASFKKHLQEDFEFIVLNDSDLDADLEKPKEVSQICNSLSIPIIEVQRNTAIEALWMRNAIVDKPGEKLFDENGRFFKGVSNAPNYMLQWEWEQVVSKESGPVCLVHSDVFLIESIVLTDYLKEHSMATTVPLWLMLAQLGDFTCLSDAFFLADIPKLPSPETMAWFPATVEGHWTDTGGPTYYWLKAHPEINPLTIGSTEFEDDPCLDFHPAHCEFFNLPDGKKVFHYLSGSRWLSDLPGYWNLSKEQSDAYHAGKLAWTRKLIGL